MAAKKERPAPAKAPRTTKPAEAGKAGLPEQHQQQRARRNLG